MTLTTSLPFRAAAGGALLLAASWPTIGASAQTRVGVNAAVNPDAEAANPGAAPRRMEIGQPVVYNEHVVTDRAGQTQLLFLDQSTMSIGPMSDLVIDRFIYDPQQNTGQLAMSTTRGVFRYIGGRLSKLDGAVTLQTPGSAVGIRGGVFLLEVTDRGGLAAIFVYGDALTVTAGGRTERATRPGYEITVAGPGALPSAPFPAAPQTITRLLTLVDGQAGKSGGAPTQPSDSAVGTTPLYGALAPVPGSSPQRAPGVGDCPSAQQPPLDVGCRQIPLQLPNPPLTEPTRLPPVNQGQLAPNPLPPAVPLGPPAVAAPGLR